MISEEDHAYADAVAKAIKTELDANSSLSIAKDTFLWELTDGAFSGATITTTVNVLRLMGSTEILGGG